MKYLGISLIFLGAAMLVGLHFSQLVLPNECLLGALLIIIIGVVLHVVSLKRNSRY